MIYISQSSHLHNTAVTLDITQPNLKQYLKIRNDLHKSVVSSV